MTDKLTFRSALRSLWIIAKELTLAFLWFCYEFPREVIKCCVLWLRLQWARRRQRREQARERTAANEYLKELLN